MNLENVFLYDSVKGNSSGRGSPIVRHAQLYIILTLGACYFENPFQQILLE